MAKFEHVFTGEHKEVVAFIEETLISAKLSCVLEAASDYHTDDVDVAVRVYERYSFTGGNRLSISITVVSNKDKTYLTAITSGGSQAVFYKINRIGENRLLSQFESLFMDYIQETNNHA